MGKNMADIIKVYRQTIPAMKFIGKKYGDKDRINGMFGSKWSEWWQNGWFELLEKQMGIPVSEVYEDGNSYLGMMRWKENEPFEYWIGMFLPENTQVPDGFAYRDFSKSILGVCWIYGKQDDVYNNENKCAEKLQEEGMEIIPDEKGALWFFLNGMVALDLRLLTTKVI
jgi:hypothetical protein